MTFRHICALILLTLGVAVLLLSATALIVLPRPYGRLHALTPATSLGVPLVALALAVETGPGRGAVKFLVIAALTAVGGPVTTMAIGRGTAQNDGLLRKDSPS
ncbi:cation:proton antiporter [Streptomyces silvisoli]|uniref:Monovalent cation/H(+) antiporter subunit G n=1 Tax=Streptomyces silvisoli TaxID=3034235 RepID=A0ABT5ZED0_9ACTN|nr:monovalent cation/H(+) antiporter subunit G [Streptomyces silvisoli]MDF3288180.1 monovalent cation/H(+) antiporter subunit G [Streptomyces silvisoli]